MNNPEEVLKEVCNFLECDYTATMTTLKKPAENLGDARGCTEIMKNNKGKYFAQLSLQQLTRIEEIVFNAAEAKHYLMEKATRFRPLNKISLKIFTLNDMINAVNFHISEKGLSKGLSYFTKLHFERNSS